MCVHRHIHIQTCNLLLFLYCIFSTCCFLSFNGVCMLSQEAPVVHLAQLMCTPDTFPLFLVHSGVEFWNSLQNHQCKDGHSYLKSVRNIIFPRACSMAVVFLYSYIRLWTRQQSSITNINHAKTTNICEYHSVICL